MAAQFIDLNDKLESAIKLDDYDSVVRLVERGADVSYSNNGPAHWTALCHAARYGKIEFVKLLMEYGATNDHKDEFDRTASMLAVIGGFYDVAEYIRSYNDVPVKGVNYE